MWKKALTVIPRISKEEWNHLDIVSRWLIATRAAVFVMTLISGAIGGLLAVRDSVFSINRFIACLVGLTFAHATNNLINDLTDHFQGVDKNNYFRAQYGPQPLEHGLLSIKQMLLYTVITGTIAASAAVYLVLATGKITLTLAAAGAFFVLFYTFPLKHIGLGEPAVLVVWGPLMIGGTSYVVQGSGAFPVSHALIGFVYAIAPTCVLFGKHTDKLLADKEKKIRTLPVLLGEKAARFTVIFLLVAQWVGTFLLIAKGLLGWPLLITLLAFPALKRTIAVYQSPRPVERPSSFPSHIWPTYLSAYAFAYTRTYGSLFLFALALDTIRVHWIP